MVKRRWDPSESDSEYSDSSYSSSSSSSSLEVLSETTLTPNQKAYLEIGKEFLEISKLQWWFDSWDPSIPFNYVSDCSLFALKDFDFTMKPLCPSFPTQL